MTTKSKLNNVGVDNNIVNNEPKIVNVKTLCQMYNVDGKYIRRHIRAHFTIGAIRKQSGVNNATYEWHDNDKQWVEMVAYFDKLLKQTQTQK